jgi:hypothetical protein
MKIFVATRKGQGGRENDFCFTVGREPVRLAVECDDDDGPDGICGCKRSMCGMRSGKPTTTFMVANVKMTKEEYFKLARNSYKSWIGINGITEEVIRNETVSLLDLAKSFEPEVILEKRGPGIQIRRRKKKR